MTRTKQPATIECPECLEPCNELVDADGYQVCPECRDAFEADQAQHDDEFQQSLEGGDEG